MSTTTQAARYSADHIDTGSDDEACARCEGDGCTHCHGRGLVPAPSAPTGRFSRSSSPRVAPGGPGTVRYGRATRERSRRIAERVAAATAPCCDCDGRGYDCERWPDGTERADATPVACTTCEGAGTLPLSIVMLLARRAA